MLDFHRVTCLVNGYLQGRCCGVYEKGLIRLRVDIRLHREEIVPVNEMLRVIRLEVLIIVERLPLWQGHSKPLQKSRGR